MAQQPSDQRLSPGLYIVATPIGNLGDMTVRAIETLRRCDVVACEDTRVTGKLLKHLGITTRLWRYDDHSDSAARARLVAIMRDSAVALVSDAGTPLISDPGYRLVRETRQAGIAITSLPGPCAAITALTLSGLPSDRFLFAGFLPVKDKARLDMLTGLAAVPATLVFYETGPRLVKALDAIAAALPGRAVSVGRELTKLHEECRTGTPQELAAHYAEHPPKGEIVLLVAPPGAVSTDDLDPDALLREALADFKPSQAAAHVARTTGLDRKTLYARALELGRS
ncbi:MAG: 16S rRNA (cytidine(1402)-2'-O)-methyltransferase [Sphingomonadaceae bacterium]